MNKTKKAKIIVVYTDIRGSSRWTRTLGDNDAARHSFMMAHDRETLFFKKRTKADFHKRLGDGRMFVYEVEVGTESAIAVNVLKEALGLIARVYHLIAMLRMRPSGFRVRVMSGHGIKESFADGQTDWDGDLLNSCHEFLAHAPEVPLMIDAPTKQLLSPNDLKAARLDFELLDGAGPYWVVSHR